MMNPSDMMNHTGGWMGGGMVIWTVVGIVVVILLFDQQAEVTGWDNLNEVEQD